MTNWHLNAQFHDSKDLPFFKSVLEETTEDWLVHFHNERNYHVSLGPFLLIRISNDLTLYRTTFLSENF